MLPPMHKKCERGKHITWCRICQVITEAKIKQFTQLLILFEDGKKSAKQGAACSPGFVCSSVKNCFAFFGHFHVDDFRKWFSLGY
jgi:hypothetical protein